MDGRVNHTALKEFVARVFVKMDVPGEDAQVVADVLVAANLRGIDSHGVARTRRYVQGLRDGMMLPRPDIHEHAICCDPQHKRVLQGLWL